MDTIEDKDIGMEILLYAEIVLEALDKVDIDDRCGYTREDICTWMLCQHLKTPAEA